MEEHALNGEYISALRNGVLSYGGSQRWLDSGAPIPPWSGGIRPLPVGGQRLPAVYDIGREGEIGGAYHSRHTGPRPGMPGWGSVAYTSCSISSTSSPNRARALFTGSGELMSTPAIFSRLMGSVLQPPDRNFL